MAKKTDKSFNIAVVGLSGTDKDKGALGVGKSCLCNRFVSPHADSYATNHISILSQTDFSGRVVNNDHFLYWGEVYRQWDDDELTFHIIEQTEFIDDTSFQPLRGTNTAVYHRRCTGIRLHSAEKLMYICKDQLALEHEYPQKQLPDGKINIDGFLCVFDVSNVSNRTLDQQTKFLDSVLSSISKTKKPVVIATTKCDEGFENYRKEAEKYASSKKVQIVETSAHENVNVDTAFLLLAQNIDKKIRVKNTPYSEASKHQKQLIDSVTEKYSALLKSAVEDCHTLWKITKEKFVNNRDYLRYVDVLGEKSAHTIFRKHIRLLKDTHQTKKLVHYLNTLPKAFEELLPDLETIDGRPWQACHQIILNHPNFDKWFVKLGVDENWKESDFIHTEDPRIPYDVLTRNEQDTEMIFRNHINKLNAEEKKSRMRLDFKKLLEKTGTITPGKPFDDVIIFLMGDESYRLLDEQDKKKIYHAHQRELAEGAKEDFRELLFEHSELFAKLDSNKNVSKEDLKEIHEALKREPRYAALSLVENDRDVLLLRHIGFVHNPRRETCLSADTCMDNLVEKCFDGNAHRPSSWNRHSSYVEPNNKLNVVLLGADGLADELANEIRSQSCEEDYTLDGSIHSLELRPIEGNVSLAMYGFRTPEFSPNACICVYTNQPSLEYISNSLQKTVLPSEEVPKPEFPGLPLAIIFAREVSNSDAENLELQQAGQLLADRLQCAFVDMPKDPLWHGKRFHDAQITQSFRAIIATIRIRSGLSGGENNREIMEPDIKIQLCMMCGDPYPADLVLGPLVNHQCCWINPDKAQTIALDTFLGSEKRKVEVMAVSYHQATTLKQDLHHGYILAYSAKRKASFSMLKAFSQKVTHVPILIVAVTDTDMFFSDSDAQKLVTEGNKWADELKVKFITASAKFRQQAAVFTSFFKESFDKKSNSEAHFRLIRSLSIESVNTGPVINMRTRKPEPLPPGTRLSLYNKASDYYDVVTPPPKYNTTGRPPKKSKDAIDLIHNTSIQRRPPPPTPPSKPPRISESPHEDGDVWVRNSVPAVSSPKEPANTGWVSNTIYESIDPISTKSVPPWQHRPLPHSLPPGDGPYPTEDIGWKTCEVYESVKDSPARQEHTLVKKSHPPPVAPRPALKPKPNVGKLDLSLYAISKTELKLPKAAPLATPDEDDYSTPKDYVKPPMQGGIYSDVADVMPKGKSMMVRVAAPPTDSESDHSSLERNKKGNDVYAMVSKKEHKKKSKRGAPEKSSSSSLSDPSIPPPLPEITSKRLESNETSSDSDGKAELATTKKPKRRSLRRSQKQIVESGTPSDEQLPGMYDDYPARVRVLPPSAHEDIENEDVNHDEKLQRKKKGKEEKELEKQRRREEKRQREEEKKKQKEEEKRKRDERRKKQSVQAGKGGGTPSVSYNYFGESLEDIVTDEERVPLFVVKCVEYLEEQGLTAEGLYRVPGKAIDSDLILQKFDEDNTVNIAELNVGVNAVATALKFFFSELPEPVIPVSMQRDFLEAVGRQDDTKLTELKRLLGTLPHANADVFGYMMTHLNMVTQYSQDNLMNCENLSVCWWPTLLHPEFNSFEAMAQNMKMRDIIELFISKARYFFVPEET